MTRREAYERDVQALLSSEGELVFFADGTEVAGIFELLEDRDDNGGNRGNPATTARLWISLDDLPGTWRGSTLTVRGDSWRIARLDTSGEILCCLEITGNGVAFS